MFGQIVKCGVIVFVNSIMIAISKDVDYNLLAVESIDRPSLSDIQVPSKFFQPPYRDDEERPKSFVPTTRVPPQRNRTLSTTSAPVRNQTSAPVKCGGTFTMTLQTMITSPNYPRSYPPNANCEYLIKSPLKCFNEFHVQFLNFALEFSKKCHKDHVVIGDDQTNENRFLCGRVIGIQKFNTSDGTLKLKFVSDGSEEKMGFKLLITRLPCFDESDVEIDNTVTPRIVLDNRTNDSRIMKHVEVSTEIPKPSRFFLPPYLKFAHERESTTTTLATPTKLATPTSTPTKLVTPTSTTTKLATPTSTPTKLVTPTSTPTKLRTPTSTPTKLATPTSTTTKLATRTSTTTTLATPTSTVSLTTKSVPTETTVPVVTAPAFVINVPDQTIDFELDNQNEGLPTSFRSLEESNVNELSRNINFLQDTDQLQSRALTPSVADSVYSEDNLHHVDVVPTNNILPPTTSSLAQPFSFSNQNRYLPPIPDPPSQNGYLPPVVTTIPTKSTSSNEYLPPTKPAPTTPTLDYLPPTFKGVDYLPPTTAVVPITPRPATYLPPTVRTNDYLPPKGHVPDNTYIPAFGCSPDDVNNSLCQPMYPITNGYDPHHVPTCCANIFNAQKFYLASQGFPTSHDFLRDCTYVIQRTSPYFCRVRIDFKFFNVGDPKRLQDCDGDFLELDGQRICGCQTGMSYLGEWSDEPKILRLRMTGRQFSLNSGFLLDVTQEPCPYRYARSTNGTHVEEQLDESATNSSRVRRHSFYGPYEITNQNPEFLFVPQPSEDRCLFNLGDWIGLSVDSSWIQRPACVVRR